MCRRAAPRPAVSTPSSVGSRRRPALRTAAAVIGLGFGCLAVMGPASPVRRTRSAGFEGSGFGVSPCEAHLQVPLRGTCAAESGDRVGDVVHNPIGCARVEDRTPSET